MTKNLTDEQKEEIKSHIDRDEFLPKKYKGILFQSGPVKRKERDKTKLSNGWGHVNYEHTMLKFTKEALVKCFPDSKLACDTRAVSTASGTPMNLKDPKQEDLRDALDALLVPGNSSTNMENLQKALLESFLIHFRNLYDFYGKERKCKDDMVAGDFFREWDISSAIPESLREIRPKANKYLSHLTWTRVKESEPEWKYKQMEKEIEKMRTTLSEKLPDFLTSPKDGGVS